MASLFSFPTNISPGTYVTDGLRSGPAYSSLTQTNGGVPLAPLSAQSNYYNNYGPGILYSPQNTWNIVPYASTAGNIVAATTPVAAGFLTLTQDTFATTLVPSVETNPVNPAGKTYVQFDWPRVVSVNVSGVALAAPVNVTIFGEDWYGFPMQHTYTVPTTAVPFSYPHSLATFATPAKAFYAITGVYVGAGVGAGRIISIQTTNTFGLPYKIADYSPLMNFSWAGNNMKDQYGQHVPGVIDTPAVLAGTQNIQLTAAAAGTTDLSVGAVVARTSFAIVAGAGAGAVNWFIADGAKNLIAPADATDPTAFTGDVRGLFKLPEAGQTWAAIPNGVRRCLFTPYQFGSDQWINQLAAGGQPQGAGTTVPPLTKEDLVGNTQYYTGIPL